MLELRSRNRGEALAARPHWLTEHLAVGGCFPMRARDAARQAHGIGAIVDLGRRIATTKPRCAQPESTAPFAHARPRTGDA